MTYTKTTLETFYGERKMESKVVEQPSFFTKASIMIDKQTNRLASVATILEDFLDNLISPIPEAPGDDLKQYDPNGAMDRLMSSLDELSSKVTKLEDQIDRLKGANLV